MAWDQAELRSDETLAGAVPAAGSARTTTSRGADVRGELRGHEVAKATLDPVADHGTSHRLGDHEPDPAARGDPGRGVHHQGRTSCANPGTGHATEVGRFVQTGGSRKHRGSSGKLRPRAWRDPCRGGRTGSRDRRGSASAAGSRGCGCGAGCSAGRFACSREDSPGVRSRSRTFVRTPAEHAEGTDGVPLVTATHQRYGGLPNRSNRWRTGTEGSSDACPADTPRTLRLVLPEGCIGQFAVASVAARLHFTSYRGLRGLLHATSSPSVPGAPGDGGARMHRVWTTLWSGTDRQKLRRLSAAWRRNPSWASDVHGRVDGEARRPGERRRRQQRTASDGGVRPGGPAGLP